MIAVIRIRGDVKIREEIRTTFEKLLMLRKFVCVLIDEKDSVRLGMVQKLKEYTMVGKIDDELIKKLIERRGKTLDGKSIDKKHAEKILGEIKNNEWKIKRFFRLHPPIGGFKKSTKLVYPRGILGENKDMAKLLERML